MIALWLAFSASAATVDVSHFPVSAPVELPASGPVRIAVPPALRSLDDPGDGSDLLLVDAEGRPVPVAALHGGPAFDEVPVAVRPADDPRGGTGAAWAVDVGLRPVDALRVELPSTPLAATVTVYDARGEAVSEPTRIWRLRGGVHDLVHLRPSDGRLTLVVEPHGNGRVVAPSVKALRQRSPGVAPDRLRLPVANRVVQENGWIRHDLVLPQPLPVRAVHLDPVEAVFQREAAVVPTPTHALPDVLGPDVYPHETTPVERVRLGHVDVEQVRVPVSERSDALSLLVEARGLPPLTLGEVEVELAGLQLVVEDPGPGPHTLYGGAPAGTAPVWDLAAASPELARLPTEVIAPGEVRPHPGWIPPEVRAELAGPGTTVPLEGFRFRRPVRGEGLVRVPLPHDVLARTRADLGDLRLLTEDGRQVPYLLRRRGGEQALRDLPVERVERGGESVLTITLPHPDVPVSSVHLRTPATLFERRVTVSRVGGASLVPLRSVPWHATDRPGTLGVALEQRVGDRLVITIENGDDPPLPVDAVEVRWPAWEIVARLPDEPVALWYGDPRRTAPSYDLALLDGSLRHRAADLALLGDAEATSAAPLTTVDRALVAGGLGILVLGLGGLLVALVRATPEDLEGEPPHDVVS